MNRNHYDAKQVCSVKAKRISKKIEKVEEAMGILEELPQDLIQHEWNKVVDRIQGSRLAGKEKTKPISKGVYKRSMRKTLQCIKVELQKALNQITERLEEAKADEQQREKILMQQLKAYIAQQQILLSAVK